MEQDLFVPVHRFLLTLLLKSLQHFSKCRLYIEQMLGDMTRQEIVNIAICLAIIQICTN